MASDSVQRRLAAILSADAVGYSRLMGRDEATTLRTLKAHRDALGGHVRQYGGRVVDDVGDNLLAEFPSVVDAVGCALEAQRALSKRNAELPEEERMPFRIGIHLGDVVAEGERIYGEGVNIAARIEALAEPGGVCISGTVQEQVRSRFGAVCADLGEQSLKNIDHPVRVHRLRLDESPAERNAAELSVPGFGGRPAIAVLALDNLSGDPEQEYFADGIAEDLITQLSCMRRLPVIARNSSFVYKGRAVDVKQVSRELGVRYVVEGSVRKAGDRVRVTAQLIDATTGHHLWAERYDRELTDIFSVQDEITDAIARAVLPAVGRVEGQRLLTRAAESLDAWDCVQRAQWHLRKLTRDDNRQIQTLCRRALELDPRFAPAMSLLAVSHLYDVFNQWSDDPASSLDEALRLAERSVELDDRDSFCFEALGWACTLTQQSERAVREFERALALNPSFTRAYWGLGVALYSLRRPDEAVGMIEKAIRFSPNDPNLHLFLHNLGMAHFVAGRYEEAADCARQAIAQRPEQPASQRLLAASCGHLGRLPEAREALRAM
jgi:adenylate cyclase